MKVHIVRLTRLMILIVKPDEIINRTFRGTKKDVKLRERSKRTTA